MPAYAPAMAHSKAKPKAVFRCRSCGGVQFKWMGKCPDCGTWDALEEEQSSKGASRDRQKGLVEGWHSGPDAATAESPQALPIPDIPAEIDDSTRLRCGLSELDRVLGGGLVAGSAVLVGGEPGIGKSTLMLQLAGGLARAASRVLYVSSEESAQQVRLRAERLAVDNLKNLLVLADTNLNRIVEQARKALPDALVIDSIQMVYRGDMDSPPGTITQLRRCASDLVYLAKASGIAVVMVGHVTKDGQLAGPRLLEHVVDAVVSFEGDRTHAHRVVRATKNRFGTTLEVGLFEMTGTGLQERDAGLLIEARGDPRPGSVICPVMTGTRAMMVELQALTATGFLGAAKRKASGIDASRLAMLVAILEQHAGLRLADRDLFASAVGGVRVTEPAADLALLLAIAGAERRKSIGPTTCALAEVGLGGEIRATTHLEQRLREAARRGFTRAIIAREPDGKPPKLDIQNIELVPTREVAHALEELT